MCLSELKAHKYSIQATAWLRRTLRMLCRPPGPLSGSTTGGLSEIQLGLLRCLVHYPQFGKQFSPREPLYLLCAFSDVALPKRKRRWGVAASDALRSLAWQQVERGKGLTYAARLQKQPLLNYTHQAEHPQVTGMAISRPQF